MRGDGLDAVARDVGGEVDRAPGRSGAGMPEQVWRVVTHERNGGGWWTVCPNRFWERAEAEGWAAGGLRRGASNTGVYSEVGGRVQVPGWITVREGAGT